MNTRHANRATNRAAKETGTARGTEGADNPNPAASTSGLDHQGQFRVGDRISIGVRAGGLVLTQSHSGREVEVSEASLAGLIDDTYFVDHKD